MYLYTWWDISLESIISLHNWRDIWPPGVLKLKIWPPGGTTCFSWKFAHQVRCLSFSLFVFLFSFSLLTRISLEASCSTVKRVAFLPSTPSPTIRPCLQRNFEMFSYLYFSWFYILYIMLGSYKISWYVLEVIVSVRQYLRVSDEDYFGISKSSSWRLKR